MINNSNLEHLDLSHNSIIHITNISHLTSLKVNIVPEFLYSSTFFNSFSVFSDVAFAQKSNC